ncbi:MAG: NADH:flavin oxidoreductase [Deltaproteobacteria bacterium]|nr:NADH:flavin oxidoreductase [Deltaproteobacteria bacterium]
MNTDPAASWLFEKASLGPLQLRNRILRSGCFEGMCPNGAPSEPLLRHHRDIAAGGAALTTVAYCAVSADGRSYSTEMWMRPEIVPDLKRLVDAVHQEGCAASIQIGHCGGFSDPRVIGGRALAPSRVFCAFRLSFPIEMSPDDLERVAADFGRTTALARKAGFDAVEVHAGHGYLLSQFLTAHTNRRQDPYGGNLEARCRFPAEVVARVRAAAGPGMAVLVKMNVNDGFPGGQTPADSTVVAALFEDAGADALVTSGGFTSRTPFYMLRGKVPIREMARNEKNALRRAGLVMFGRIAVREYPFSRTFFLDDASPVARSTRIPVALVGGVCDLADVNRARSAGFSFVVMGRALIRDPGFPTRLEKGETTESDCDHCNRCVAAMDAGGVYCVTRAEEEASIGDECPTAS